MRPVARLLLVLGVASCSTPPDRAPSLGPEWVRLPGVPLDADLRCAAYSHDRWIVEAAGPHVVARPPSASDRVDPPPFALPKREDLFGETHVLKVHDGWLVGFDGGEFGGGLWWFGPGGTPYYSMDGARDSLEAIAAPVQGFAELQGEILVLRGLDHLSLAIGGVFVAERDKGHWALEPLAELDGQPIGWLERDGFLLVATNSSIWKLGPQGPAEALLPLNPTWPRATSIAANSHGDLFLGMPRYVVQLQHDGDTWLDTWHVPAACVNAELLDWECRCLPS